MFCKIYRYPKHRKMLSQDKLIIINFTLWDIDNTKPSHKLGAVYENLFSIFKSLFSIYFLFLAGLSVVFSRATSLLILPKIGCLVNILVVSDDQATANFKHCSLLNINSTF